MKLKELIKTIGEITPIEVEIIDRKAAKIYLKEYGFTYTLNFYDWYFAEALQIISSCNYTKKNKKNKKDKKMFSADDLLELRYAIREDHNHFGGIYRDYFYEAPYFEELKDSVDKQYVLDYIKFINRATGFED